MTTSQFVEKYNTKKIDWDKVNGGQCTDLFRQFCHEVLNIPQPKALGVNGGAYKFWTEFEKDPVLVQHFDKINNTASFIPQEGDIALWNTKTGGGFGHVAVVANKTHTTSYFYSFDQNWYKVSYCEIVKHDYSHFYGVLRPKVLSITEPMPEKIPVDKKEFEELVKKSSAYDEIVKLGYTDANTIRLDVETYKDRVVSVKKELDDFILDMVKILDPNTVAEISDKDLVRNLAKQLVNENSQLQTAQKQLEKEADKREKELESENARLETQVKLLKQELEDMRIEHALEIDRLEKRINQVCTDVEYNKEKREQLSALVKFIETVTSFFKRKK